MLKFFIPFEIQQFSVHYSIFSFEVISLDPSTTGILESFIRSKSVLHVVSHRAAVNHSCQNCGFDITNVAPVIKEEAKMNNGWKITGDHQGLITIEYNAEKQRCFVKCPEEEPSLKDLIYMLGTVEKVYKNLPANDFWDVMWDITDIKLFTKETLWVFGHFTGLMVYKYPFIRRYRICSKELAPHAIDLLDGAAQGEEYTHTLEPRLFKSRRECEAYIDSYRGFSV